VEEGTCVAEDGVIDVDVTNLWKVSLREDDVVRLLWEGKTDRSA
jgi:hypothetical protein